MSTKITINSNGSIRVEGEFEIGDVEGKAFDLAGRTAIGLCRCGASENKPFCDGSHRKVGFQDDATLRAAESPPAPHPGGRVAIRARPNGPLMLTGPLTVVGANDRRAFAESTFLCRCGASGNKPYCDGT